MSGIVITTNKRKTGPHAVAAAFLPFRHSKSGGKKFKGDIIGTELHSLKFCELRAYSRDEKGVVRIGVCQPEFNRLTSHTRRV